MLRKALRAAAQEVPGLQGPQGLQGPPMGCKLLSTWATGNLPF